jgi:RNA polymerase sigma-70 factor (ECF subfamily)
MNAPSDKEYAERASKGDGQSFSALVRRHQDRVYRYVLRMMGCREDALELTQEVFLRAYRALPSWRPDALFSTWLFRIATNVAIDGIRKRKLATYISIDECKDLVAHTQGPEELAEAGERGRLLESALQQLPLEYREVLLLREIEEMSYSEIAQVLRIREGTVKSRISRARGLLLQLYRRQCGEV